MLRFMNHNKISAEPGKSRASEGQLGRCRAPSHKSMSFHVKRPGCGKLPGRLPRLPATGGCCRITGHGPTSTQHLCAFRPLLARGSHRRIADAGGGGPAGSGGCRGWVCHISTRASTPSPGSGRCRRRGLAGLDPTLIPYAPPGFPFLVGVAYLGLGVSDLAAILVSILAGTLTIPAAAWLARRTFGAGAGAAAAALVAFSGFHVAFSRVALTDASFLLCWILALVCGQRFLERPRFSSAIALGLSVGLAQWFKYNGWLLGVFVVLAACLGILVDPKERHRPRIRAVWGFGLTRRARCRRSLLALVCLRRSARGIRRIAEASPELHGRLHARGCPICGSSSSRWPHSRADPPGT